MDERLLQRIERAAGVRDLVDVLADRLPATDLQSLLLEVFRRRTERLSAARVLAQYERSRFVAPSPVPPATMAAFDQVAFGVLGELGYTALELSPVGPLGMVTAVATVDQNNVLTTNRTGEVVADSTNSLALECALRRRALLRAQPRDRTRIQLCASHRLVRAQRFEAPGQRSHFRLLALTTAGRDEGSFRFETRSLLDELTALLHVLAQSSRVGLVLSGVRVTVTELAAGQPRPALRESVLSPLAERFPDVAVSFDDEREGGRGYYAGACFHIHAVTPAGRTLLVADGGFTTWTAQLLGNAKERLLISSLGTERLCGEFHTT
jgi:hypothetical protein